MRWVGRWVALGLWGAGRASWGWSMGSERAAVVKAGSGGGRRRSITGWARTMGRVAEVLSPGTRRRRVRRGRIERSAIMYVPVARATDVRMVATMAVVPSRPMTYA